MINPYDVIVYIDECPLPLRPAVSSFGKCNLLLKPFPEGAKSPSHYTAFTLRLKSVTFMKLPKNPADVGPYTVAVQLTKWRLKS